METGWIQVFILTLAQCVAPEGKMVCQQERVEFQFASEEDCRGALMQMLDYAARTDNVIVDRQRSSCRVAVREARVFASGDDARAALGDADDVVLIEGEAPRPDFTQAAHRERLERLRSCEETGGTAPCKIGEIIIEPAVEEKIEVWRRAN